MTSIRRNLTLAIVSILLTTTFASAGKRQTATAVVDEDFSPAAIETIAVLSVADVRKDKSVNLKKLDEIGQRTVRRSLKKSSYNLAFEEDFGGAGEITGEDLEYLDAEWVRDLGPSSERYVMLLVLEDAARKKTYGSAFGAICSGFLFDRETGDTMWQSQATGTMGQGGLIGFAMNNAMRAGAFEVCAGKLMTTFPREKRTKKKRSN